MPFLGFSINLLTLFGLILAIGIVVDDAIVIVENASHHIETGRVAARGDDPGDERGDRPGHLHHARADGRVPPDGVPRRHHRPDVPPVRADHRGDGPHQRDQRADAQAGPVRASGCGRCKKNGGFPRLRRVYRPIERGYAWSIRHLLRVWWLVLLAFLGVAVFTAGGTSETPTGFLPDEDQGYVIIAVQLPGRGLARPDRARSSSR